jgi:methyl-accepting chemotaxis protein
MYPPINAAFSHPLSGDLAVDTSRSRSKRKFDGRTGIRCASRQQAVLLQTTQDTGELMHDLSVPSMAKGRHWDGLRLGCMPQK